jgi:hypothetical protein
MRFGRRIPGSRPTPEVAAEDVRSGVEALNTLSRESRADTEARHACLFYALRHVRGPVALETLVPVIDMRIAAFERLIAAEPGLIARENVTAALENAVYQAIAVEPLVDGPHGAAFDPGHFASALPLLLRREVARRQQTLRPARERQPSAFWLAAPG